MKGFSKTMFFELLVLLGITVSLVWAQPQGVMKMGPEALKDAGKKRVLPPEVEERMKRMTLKPDLVIDNIRAEVVERYPRHTTTEKVKVKVTVTVRNRNIPSSTEDSLTPEGRSRQCGGAFKVLVEWTDNSAQGYRYFCESGVAGLSGGQTSTFNCEQWIPYTNSRKFRATVDHLNWIDESNKNNNTLENMVTLHLVE